MLLRGSVGSVLYNILFSYFTTYRFKCLCFAIIVYHMTAKSGTIMEANVMTGRHCIGLFERICDFFVCEIKAKGKNKRKHFIPLHMWVKEINSSKEQFLFIGKRTILAQFDTLNIYILGGKKAEIKILNLKVS